MNEVGYANDGGRGRGVRKTVLDCTPKACKPCTCPDSRPRKEPRVSRRDISDLMVRGVYMSEAGSCSDTPLCVAEAGRAWHRLCSQEEGEVTSYAQNWVWLISCQGDQQRGVPLMNLLISYHL